MKTTTKSAIHSSDELWQWAAESGRGGQAGQKKPSSRYARVSGRSVSPRLAMAQGVLTRLYAILRGRRCTRRRI